MLTPPGPTRQPMMIITIPARTPPRMIHTMPAITRIAAMIHSSVAAPPERAAISSIGSSPSSLVRSEVPRHLRRGSGCGLPCAAHLFGRRRAGDLGHGFADAPRGGGSDRDVAECHHADELVALKDGQTLDTVLGHQVLRLTERLVRADRGDVLGGGDRGEVHIVGVE